MKFKNRMRYHLKKGGTWCVYDTYENENPNVEDKAHDVFCSFDWPWIYYPEGFLGCYHVGKPIYIRNPEKYADMFEPYYTKEEREEAKRLRRQYAGLAMSGTINALMSEAETASIAEKRIDSLTYAVFPYLPDAEYYQELIERRWAEVEPDIHLVRAEWDCYSDGAPEGIDVLMYDAVMLEQIAAAGWIQPIEHDAVQDSD